MIRTALTGYDLLNDPRLNKGTAFTEEERDRFALHGLLPPNVGTLEEQVERRLRAFGELPTPFSRYRFLRELQDTNETLFYALLQRDIPAFLPIVYTPGVGEGCQRFSEIWHQPRGLFLSYPNRDRTESILAHPRFDSVRCIVVSDGERILGLGDQGAGGMGIPIGKLALYTALGGIPPEACLPILLDVGTDNEERLRDPFYIGWTHRRVRGTEYDAFVERFVGAVERRWPDVLLQWEDFAGGNAARLLGRYRDRLCTFNDDIQGTAAVGTAVVLAAVRAVGGALRDQRVAIVGFGAAGQGIARMLASLPGAEGLAVVGIDREGIVTPGRWGVERGASLEDIVAAVRPTILVGTSGHAGAFTEAAVRAMSRHANRPVILPLSNPTSRAEATPHDLMTWTDGRALIATGSPFAGVAQANNSWIFPGLALGILAVRARRVTDGMLMAAARVLATLATGDRLLPPVALMRDASRVVAAAVAQQALADGVARIKPPDLQAAVLAATWDPVYEPYELLA